MNTIEIGDTVEKLRGLVVDDTVVYRKILTQAVENTDLCEVVKTAPNGSIALDWLAQKEFDVVLLDVFMPELDGIETLKRIKQQYPHIEVIMISSDGAESVKNTVKALELGALEFVLKPTQGDPERNIEAITRMLKVLFAQIQIKKMGRSRSASAAGGTSTRNAGTESRTQTLGAGKGPGADPVKKTGVSNKLSTDKIRAHTPLPNRKKATFQDADLILIASSTGGPVALEKVLSQLQEPLKVPLLIVQHMPKNFTRVLAQSLNQKSGLHIVEAEENMVIEPGKAIIAAGGYHMIAEEKEGKKIVKLLETEYVNGVRPAADVLFSSLTQLYRNQRILVVVLTGMGTDGTKGVAKLAEETQVFTITQSEDTCVVYGMPRSVDDSGLSDESLALDLIPARIQSFGLRRR